MVADGGDDSGHLRRFHPHFIKNAEGHGGSTDGVVMAVDHITDVMHKGGDPSQLHLSGGIAQLVQNPGGYVGTPAHMGKGMFGKAESDQGSVRLGNISADFHGVLNILKGDRHK